MIDSHLYCNFLNSLITKEDNPKGYVDEIVIREIIKKKFNNYDDIYSTYKIFSDLYNKGLIDTRLINVNSSFREVYRFNEHAIKAEIRKIKLKNIFNHG